MGSKNAATEVYESFYIQLCKLFVYKQSDFKNCLNRKYKMDKFAENMFKKRKFEEQVKIFECCICGESGHIGFTDTFQISLRENDYCLSFVDVIFFTVGINVRLLYIPI